jgi:hypothetical protein
MNEACSNKLIAVHQLLADWSITIPLDRYAKCTVSATYARWFRVPSSWVCLSFCMCVYASLSKFVCVCVCLNQLIFFHISWCIERWTVQQCCFCSSRRKMQIWWELGISCGLSIQLAGRKTLKPSGQPSGGSAVTESNCC